MHPKHILIAITGMTPQVVTETLFGLIVQKQIPVHEMFVITTVEGQRALLGGASIGALPPLKDEVARMCRQFNIPQPIFDPSLHVLVAKEETVELYDIRSDRENQLFPNLIMDFVREKTSDPGNVLHCSIAGGRKTMSVALAFALSLFGRKDDKLYHVLVSKEFETAKKFFPETPEEAAQLALAEVPYIRLREKLPLLRDFPLASFSDYVAIGQGEIDKLLSLPPLVFERRNHRVRIGDHVISFPPREFAFYLFVARHKHPIPGGKQFTEANWKRLLKLYDRISTAAGHKERLRRTISGKMREELLAKAGSTIRRKLRKTLGDELAKWYGVSSIARYADVRYTILLPRDRIVIQ